MHQVLGVIPARLESTRLPGKPLRQICGRPMIAWVYENSRRATGLDHLLVATDSPEVERYCRQEVRTLLPAWWRTRWLEASGAGEDPGASLTAGAPA